MDPLIYVLFNFVTSLLFLIFYYISTSFYILMLQYFVSRYLSLEHFTFYTVPLWFWVFFSSLSFGYFVFFRYFAISTLYCHVLPIRHFSFGTSIISNNSIIQKYFWYFNNLLPYCATSISCVCCFSSSIFFFSIFSFHYFVFGIRRFDSLRSIFCHFDLYLSIFGSSMFRRLLF